MRCTGPTPKIGDVLILACSSELSCSHQEHEPLTHSTYMLELM